MEEKIMGLLPCLDMLDLIRFCLLTVMKKTVANGKELNAATNQVMLSPLI